MSEKNFKKYLNVYEFESELPGSGETVKFKPLTTNNMKKLLQYEDEKNLYKISEALDELIKLSVVDENFDIDNMYLRDRFKLLIDIRKKTKGEQYSFSFNCPECGSQNMNGVNLDELQVKKKDNDIGKIDIYEDVSLEVEHIKRKDEKEAISYISDIENLSESKVEIEHWVNTIASSILSIETPEGKDEDLSFEDKKYIVENTSNCIENIGN